MNDKELRQDIIKQLDFEPSIDSADIGVAVESGVVTLTGHVPTYAQRMMAEEVVQRIKGVKGIAQDIEVRPFLTLGTSDDEIAKRVLNTFKWNSTVPEDAIQVKVQNGWVTLTGMVEWQYQKQNAADAIQGLSGILGVLNNISVTPRASVPDVRKRIEEALRRQAEVHAKDVIIQVADGKVTLDGRVSAWTEKAAIGRAAWSAPGVKAVEDNLIVL
ncbi:BON domain-containing protein [Taklimakanibacter deserti]|uniref:BON domain-containing protein n=1 Tax=Taklimakanibacter deserti TaxID=2267839 RepID=UPI000E659D93